MACYHATFNCKAMKTKKLKKMSIFSISWSQKRHKISSTLSNKLVGCCHLGTRNHSLKQGFWVGVTTTGVRTQVSYYCKCAGVGTEEEICQWFIRNICLLQGRGRCGPCYSVVMTIDASTNERPGHDWTRRREMTLVALCLRLTLSLRGFSCLTASLGHWPIPS